MAALQPYFESVFPSTAKVKQFQRALIEWFEREGKDYPWRATRDSYAILVSELMLQQTRVATVLQRGYFSRWMKQFPDWESLAGAAEVDILKAWEGLGYYNRARNLQKAAVKICTSHGGETPETMEEILALPGVGRYTAGAVFSFAFEKRAPIVDGNVIRVFSRIFGFEDPVDEAAAGKQFWDWADRLLPEKEVRSYNSAIMELGQQCCTRTSPSCDICPVFNFCRARAEGMTEDIPRKKGKQKITEKEEKVGLAISAHQVFLCRETGARRRGLWRLPEISTDEAADLVELFRFPYAITRYRVDLRVYQIPESVLAELEANFKGEWHRFGEGEELPPLGSPYRKAISKFQDSRGQLL